jgi:hypothetical protein
MYHAYVNDCIYCNEPADNEASICDICNDTLFCEVCEDLKTDCVCGEYEENE